jgi:glutathione peroxidase
MTTTTDFSVRAADGATTSLSAWSGKALLIVNVASKCGFTPQYAGLQDLQNDYAGRGFSVLAFPCNQFGAQEPGTEGEICEFATRKFQVTFPIFAKIEVNGPKADPLWTFLKTEKSGVLGDAIKWNFTKFLVDRQGRVASRHPPTMAPEALKPAIEALLAD